MLALVVELLVTALTGAAIGFEASSFFVDAGNRPRLGQAFPVVDPEALAGQGVYLGRGSSRVDCRNGQGRGRAATWYRRYALASKAAGWSAELLRLAEQLRVWRLKSTSSAGCVRAGRRFAGHPQTGNRSTRR